LESWKDLFYDGAKYALFYFIPCKPTRTTMSKQASAFFDALVSALPWNSKSPSQQQQQSLIVTVAIAAGLPFACYYCYALRHRKPYPPGPPGLPIIGNIHQLPNPSSGESLEAKFLEWYVSTISTCKCLCKAHNLHT
jgi:hypothetical protein